MAQEDQLGVIDLGSGLTVSTVNPAGALGSAPNAYHADHTFLKASKHYRLWLTVKTYPALVTIFSAAAGTAMDERYILPGVYEMNLHNYGAKIKNATTDEVATYQFWFER